MRPELAPWTDREEALRGLLEECLHRFRLAYTSAVLVADGNADPEEPPAVCAAAIALLVDYGINDIGHES